MAPRPALNLVPAIQQAITVLLTTYEPEFLRFGYNLFLSFAVILIAWHGIRMMLSHDGLGDQMFEFAKLLLFIAFGYGLIAFYESPLPGIGGLLQQPDHRPDRALRERPGSTSVRQHLSAFR